MMGQVGTFLLWLCFHTS